MTLKELKNEVNGLLSTVAPQTYFLISINQWSSREKMDMNLALYKDDSKCPEVVHQINENFRKITPTYIETPQQLLEFLKKAIDTYKKEAKINYKTLELDELNPEKSDATFSNHFADDSLF